MKIADDESRYPEWSSGVEPAPGDLRIVQAFVNTIDLETGDEELTGPRELGAWLVEWRLLPPAVGIAPADHARAIALREGLRALLVANNGGPLDTDAVAELDRAASRTRLRMRCADDGAVRLEPVKNGFDDAVARILELVLEAQSEGLWPRLKACRSETCRWAFYDFSKNRAGRWCTMSRCGNLKNARAYRRRKARH